MEEKKLSSQEKIKDESIYLKGNLAEELADGNDFVSDESYELLKFHGSYQGYDRDTATVRKKAGLDKEWEFMVRMTCPGGKLEADQYLGLDKICDEYANGTLRITTRETFQFHSIIKKNLKKHIAKLNDLLISCLGGCGDVVRNVVCSNAPINDVVHKRLLEDAIAVAKFTKPKTSAYHEIWLDGENLARTDENEDLEPLYGKHYMPRKFKIGFAVPMDNSVDVLANDLAFVLIFEGEKLKGYNVCLGGGMGVTHNKPETYPRIATPIAFVGADDLIKATEAVIKLQRDHGDRTNRKHARLKYVVQENGIAWTRKTLEEYFGSKMQDPVPVDKYVVVDHMGWHDQKDGKFYYGLPVSSGRIVDRGGEKIKTAIRQVVEKYKCSLRLTADQNLLFCDISPSDKDGLEAILKQNGVKLIGDITKLYRNTISCVALPTCGKALAEAERIKLPIVAEFEEILEKYNILNEKLAFRIAGCPNGCSRPYSGDIAIVGRMPDHYALYIGGDFEGTRLNSKIIDRVPYVNLKEVFGIIIEKFVSERNLGEGLGDYAHRIGVDQVGSQIVEKLGAKYKWAVLA